MPQTIDTTSRGQIIGGTFHDQHNADLAVEALYKLGVAQANIQVVRQVNDEQDEAIYTDILTARGFANAQAHFYDERIREGKVLVVVYEVAEPALIIDVFDKYKAEYNPNGSRNLRQDVLGMTTGAAVGAAALGVAGAAVGGPIGAALGMAAGAVVGGGSGAVVGKTAEHNK